MTWWEKTVFGVLLALAIGAVGLPVLLVTTAVQVERRVTVAEVGGWSHPRAVAETGEVITGGLSWHTKPGHRLVVRRTERLWGLVQGDWWADRGIPAGEE